MKFLYDPLPHSEAAKMLAGKPAVLRAVFDAMEPEMKLRAFTIAGVEDFDILQGVRDQIAALPAGADWGQVKKEIAAKISPWLDAGQAAARAELLMRHHAFSAYSAAEARMQDEMIDVFPYRQYLSAKDGKVRASHAALHGIILPANHPFWQDHTPPWEFNCRCQVVPLTEEDAGEERARDAARNPEDRRVLEGPALAHLENGRIARGPSVDIPLGKSLQRTADFNIPYDKLAARWDAQTRAEFEQWAADIPLESGSLLTALRGGISNFKSQISNTRRPRAASFAAALADSGLADKAVWTRADLANLRSRLRVPDPAQAADLVSAVTGARQTGVLTDKEIRRTVQDLLDILPRPLAEKLPPVQITLTQFQTDAKGNRIKRDDGSIPAGDHLPAAANGGTARIRVSMEALAGLKGEARRREMRRILSHELMHWLHRDCTHPRAAIYRKAVRSHYSLRTGADLAMPYGKGLMRPDKFWHPRAGLENHWEKGNPSGLEIPPHYFELWETPEHAILHAGPGNPDAAAFRETFSLVHSIFDSALTIREAP